MFKHRKYNPKSWRTFLNRLDVSINLNICQGYMFVGRRLSILYFKDVMAVIDNDGENYVYRQIDVMAYDLEYELRKYRLSRYPHELFVKKDPEMFIVNMTREALNGIRTSRKRRL
jgi:hypothetical protein